MNKNTNQLNSDVQTVAASAKNLRISPRKLRLAADMIKGMPAEAALQQLRFSPSKGAALVYKVVQSAIANAVNNYKMVPSELYVKTAFCDGAQVLKRTFPRARGSAFLIRKRMAHVTIELAPGKKYKGALVPVKAKVSKKESAENVEDTLKTKVPRAKGVARKVTGVSSERKMGRSMASRRPDDGKGDK